MPSIARPSLQNHMLSSICISVSSVQSSSIHFARRAHNLTTINHNHKPHNHIGMITIYWPPYYLHISSTLLSNFVIYFVFPASCSICSSLAHSHKVSFSFEFCNLVPKKMHSAYSSPSYELPQ